MSSRILSWFVAFAYLCLAQSLLSQTVIDERAEMAKIVEWIKRHNAFGIDHQIVSDMRSTIEEETEKGFNVNLYFGKELLKGDTYQSIHLWSGQFFSFELSDAQAQSRDLKPSSVQAITGKRADRRTSQQLYEISDLKLDVDSGGNLDGRQKITGSVKIRALGDSTAGDQIAIRLSYRTDVNSSGFFYPDGVRLSATDSTIQFSFSGVNEDANSQEFLGALPMFVDVCHVEQSGSDLEVNLLSNSLGALVMVQSSPKSPTTPAPRVTAETKPAMALDERAERSKAIDWVKHNNKWGVDHAIVSDMAEVINEETENGYNINIFFGKGLLKNEKSRSIHLWSGQFFQFELSDFQARSRELGPMSVETSTGKRQDKRAAEPVFVISDLKLTNLTGTSIQGNQNITGTLYLRPLRQLEAKEFYSLRLGYRTKSTTSQFLYLKEGQISPTGGVVEFSFDAINGDGEVEPFTGALPLFLDICTVKETNGHNGIEIEVHSNSLGTLITIMD